MGEDGSAAEMSYPSGDGRWWLRPLGAAMTRTISACTAPIPHRSENLRRCLAFRRGDRHARDLDVAARTPVV